MKRPLFSVFIVASLMVAIAHCFPGAMREEDPDERSARNFDTVIVMPEERHPISLFGSLLGAPDFSDFSQEDDSSDNFSPFKTGLSWRDNSFGTIFDQMQNVLNRIQNQLAGALSGTGVFRIGEKLPENANTTSTTKVIDGHVFTLNETTYENSDNDSTVILRVNILDVRPVNDTDTSAEGEVELGDEIETVTTRVNGASSGEETTTTEGTRSVETVEDSAVNEVPNKAENFDA